MRLGILVVYFLTDADIPLLRLHLQAIRTHTELPFRIYGAANRVSEAVRAILLSTDLVDMVDVVHCPYTGSREHSCYLDQLAAHACADGVTHLCTLDVDSFPIHTGWATLLAGRLSKTTPLAAILRTENGDSTLPHPSCMFFTRDFYLSLQPRFYPEAEILARPEVSAFLCRARQLPDSGIGFSLTLANAGLDWIPLRRSNAVDEHFLLAGIYGGLIFHLGAMGWTGRVFRRDKQHSRLHRLAHRLQKGHFLTRVSRTLERAAAAWISKCNNRIYTAIRARLLADPESYFSYLQGKPDSQR